MRTMIQSIKIADTPDEALYELWDVNGFIRCPTGTLVIVNKNTGGDNDELR